MAPFISEHANASHQTNFRVDEPARIQCVEVKGGHLSLISANLFQEFWESVGQSVDGLAPIVMLGGGGKTSLIASSLVKLQRTNVAYLAQHNTGNATNPGHPVSDSVNTISSNGTEHRFGFALSEAIAPPMIADPKIELARHNTMARILVMYASEIVYHLSGLLKKIDPKTLENLKREARRLQYPHLEMGKVTHQ